MRCHAFAQDDSCRGNDAHDDAAMIVRLEDCEARFGEFYVYGSLEQTDRTVHLRQSHCKSKEGKERLGNLLTKALQLVADDQVDDIVLEEGKYESKEWDLVTGKEDCFFCGWLYYCLYAYYGLC